MATSQQAAIARIIQQGLSEWRDKTRSRSMSPADAAAALRGAPVLRAGLSQRQRAAREARINDDLTRMRTWASDLDNAFVSNPILDLAQAKAAGRAGSGTLAALNVATPIHVRRAGLDWRGADKDFDITSSAPDFSTKLTRRLSTREGQHKLLMHGLRKVLRAGSVLSQPLNPLKDKLPPHWRALLHYLGRSGKPLQLKLDPALTFAAEHRARLSEAPTSIIPAIAPLLPPIDEATAPGETFRTLRKIPIAPGVLRNMTGNVYSTMMVTGVDAEAADAMPIGTRLARPAVGHYVKVGPQDWRVEGGSNLNYDVTRQLDNQITRWDSPSALNTLRRLYHFAPNEVKGSMNYGRAAFADIDAPAHLAVNNVFWRRGGGEPPTMVDLYRFYNRQGGPFGSPARPSFRQALPKLIKDPLQGPMRDLFHELGKTYVVKAPVGTREDAIKFVDALPQRPRAATYNDIPTRKLTNAQLARIINTVLTAKKANKKAAVR